MSRNCRTRSPSLPGRQQYFPSPTDWRDEVIYFLLPDRFGERRGGDVLVDGMLNADAASSFELVQNTEAAANGGSASHRVGERLPVQRTRGWLGLWSIRDVGPSEVLVLINRS